MLQCLAADPPVWPPSTTSINELRLSIDYRPRGLGARLLARQTTLTLVIVDYPGEWLLDLPLLEKSYEEWSAETLGLARITPRAALAAPFLAAVDAPHPNAPIDAEAERLAALFTDYLRACRGRNVNLSFVQPGRFLLPGRETESDPQLTRFAPLPPHGDRDGRCRPARLRGRYDISGRKGDEDVAAAVGAVTADPGETRRRAPGQALALQRDQRRIGRQHHNDRALVARHRPGTRDHIRPDHLANRDAAAFEQASATVIGLNQRAHSVSGIADRNAA